MAELRTKAYRLARVAELRMANTSLPSFSMNTTRSLFVPAPVWAFEKPRIRPPVLVVVRNQADSVKVAVGAVTAEEVT